VREKCTIQTYVIGNAGAANFCYVNLKEVKHDVNDRRQTGKITSDFEFFSSNS